MLRIALYLVGIIVLALGITLNTKTNLGVSPIISIPYAVGTDFWTMKQDGSLCGVSDLYRIADCAAERKISTVPALTGCGQLPDQRLYYHL